MTAFAIGQLLPPFRPGSIHSNLDSSPCSVSLPTPLTRSPTPPPSAGSRPAIRPGSTPWARPSQPCPKLPRALRSSSARRRALGGPSPFLELRRASQLRVPDSFHHSLQGRRRYVLEHGESSVEANPKTRVPYLSLFIPSQLAGNETGSRRSCLPESPLP
jgi:hypothetical protein